MLDVPAGLQRGNPRQALTQCHVAQVVESLVVAMLVDRGLLAYDAPVCQYWPDFCGEGVPDVDGRRAALTVADLMRHRGGLAAPRKPIPASRLGTGHVLARQVRLICAPASLGRVCNTRVGCLRGAYGRW